MVETKRGPASYHYVCTRMRVRKSLLIPREEYLRMLNMSLPEITRSIGETGYKKEIDELATSFSGIDLVEVALSWNLAKEYQRILAITPGALGHFTENYLRSWDIQNVLTILRGKMLGVSAGRIKELLIPAGMQDRAFLDRLLAEESPERVVEALKGRHIHPILEEGLPEAMETGSFANLENQLYVQFYDELVRDATSGIKGGRIFLEYIRLEIDVKNIKNLFRLRASGIEEEITDLMIPGGSFTPGELQVINTTRDSDEFIDLLKKRVHSPPLKSALEGLRKKRPIREIVVELTRIQLDQMERMSKRHPFSICPIFVYLEKKKHEVLNLRAITRGKESHLPAEQIQGYLVM